MSATPTVAIVGRPNVGKSTLFNRLVGRRQAIVHDRPGVTRDRIVGEVELDESRHILLIDTGGLVPGDDPLGLNRQVLMAVEESDLLLLVVDGKEGLVAADERIWSDLRSRGRPTILVINKADTRAAQQSQYEFYRLGLETTALVSAEHALGVSDLLDQIAAALPQPEPRREAKGTRLAIVGRPNVGKSSLLNRLLGEDRALVSELPGTTRDPIDTVLEWQGQRYVLVDTAGIRRRGRVADEPEEIAIMMSRRQLEESELALLVIDAAAGVTSGDLSIAGSAWEMGRACLVLANKWDLVDEGRRDQFESSWPRMDEILAGPVRINISAASGRSVQKIFPAVEELLKRHRLQVSTAELNRLFESVIARHEPPAMNGKQWKLRYVTQVKTAPPTFMLFANRKIPRRSSYRRYLENSLRDKLGLRGVPIRLVVRQQ